jgi:hypothetical protein
VSPGTLPFRLTLRLLVREADDLARRLGGEFVALHHEEGGLHRLGDEGCTPLFELGGHGLAFRFQPDFEGGAFRGHVAVEAPLFVFEGGLGGEVGVFARAGLRRGPGVRLWCR